MRWYNSNILSPAMLQTAMAEGVNSATDAINRT